MFLNFIALLCLLLTLPIDAKNYEIAQNCYPNGKYANVKNCCCAPPRTITIGSTKTKRQENDIAVDHLCVLCPVQANFVKGGEPCCHPRKTITRTIHKSTTTTRQSSVRTTTTTRQSSKSSSKSRTTSKSASSSPSVPTKKPGLSTLTLTTITYVTSGTTRTKVTTATTKPTIVLGAPPKKITCLTQPASGYVPLRWGEQVKANLIMYIPSKTVVPWTCTVNSPMQITLGYANSTYSFSSFNATSERTPFGLGYIDLSGTTTSLQKRAVSIPSNDYIRVAMSSLSQTSGLPAWQLKQINRPSTQLLLSTYKSGSFVFSEPRPILTQIPLGIRQFLGMGTTETQVFSWFTRVLGIKNPTVFKMISYVDIDIKTNKTSFYVKSVLQTTPTFSYGVAINATLYQGKSWLAKQRHLSHQITLPNQAAIWNFGFTSTNLVNVCNKFSAQVQLFSIPQLDLPAENVGVKGKIQVICTNGKPSKVLATADLIASSGKSNFTIDFAPPELKMSEKVQIHYGQLIYNSVMMEIHGNIWGSSMQTRPKISSGQTFVETVGYRNTFWNTIMQIHPITGSLVQYSLNLSSTYGPNSGVHFGTLQLGLCNNKRTIIQTPCLGYASHQTAPNNVNPLEKTWNLLAKTAATKFIGSILLQNVVISYKPSNLVIQGLIEDNVQFVQKWSLPLRQSSTQLLCKIVAPSRQTGFVNVTLMNDACRGLHPASFTFQNTSSPVIPIGPRNQAQQILDTSKLYGTGQVSFSCQSKNQPLGVLSLKGSLTTPQLPVLLYENASFTMLKPSLQYASNSTRLQVIHAFAGNSSLSIHVPVDPHDVIYPESSPASWHVLSLANGQAFLKSFNLVLGKQGTTFFKAMQKTNSKAFKDLLKNPYSYTNVSYGYAKVANTTEKTSHEIFHFGRTGYDRLVGKQINLQQKYYNLTGPLRTVSVPKAYKSVPLVTLKTMEKFGPTISGFTQPRVNTSFTMATRFTGAWTIPTTLFPPSTTTSVKSSSTKMLTTTATAKSSGKSSKTFPKSGTTRKMLQRSASTTTVPPTTTSSSFSNPTYSSTALAATYLPIAANNFAYEFTLDNPGDLILNFQSSWETCPAGQQSLVGVINNSQMFGNVPQLVGRATFTCDSNNDSVSFSAQMAVNNMTFQPFKTGVPLNNVSMQVNCVPDSALCFWPASLYGGGLYSLANSMNSSSYWGSLNATQMLVNAVYGTNDTATQQAMVNAVLSQYPYMQSNIQGIMDSLPAQFILNDPLAASLIAQFQFNLPMQSFQCSTNFVQSCEYPSYLISGQINTSVIAPNAGGNTSDYAFALMYGSILQSSAKGMNIGQQSVAGAFGPYGYFAINITNDFCSDDISGITWEINDMPSGFNVVNSNFSQGEAYSTQGFVALDCSQVDVGIVDWSFTDASFHKLAMTLPLPQGNTQVSQTSVTLAYYSINDTFGIVSDVNGYYLFMNFAGTDSTQTMHVTAWSSMTSSLKNFINTQASNGGEALVQAFYVILETTTLSFKSFTMSTQLNFFKLDYNTASLQTTLQANLEYYVSKANIYANNTVIINGPVGSPGYSIQSDKVKMQIVFGTNQNFVNVSSGYIPCSQGVNNVNGGLQSNKGNYTFNLPNGIGSLQGQAQTNFACSGTSISSFNANGNVTGPVVFEMFNSSVQVNSTTFSYSSGSLYIPFTLGTATVTPDLQFTPLPVLTKFVMTSPWTVNPINSSLPFSSFWNSTMASLNLSILISDYTLTYTATTNSSSANYVITGGVNVGDYDASVTIKMVNKTSGWTLNNFEVDLALGSTGSVGSVAIKNANHLCNSPNGFYNGALNLNAFGPLPDATALSGSIEVFCNGPNVSYYYAQVSASGVTMSLAGAQETVSLSGNYNSSDGQLFLNITGDNWTGSLSVDYSLNYVLTATCLPSVTFTSEPFGTGLTSVLLPTSDSALTSASLKNFMLVQTGTRLNFTGTVSEASGSYQVGSGVSILMTQSGSTWTLVPSSSTSYTSAYTVGPSGFVGVSGTLSCPSSHASATVTISGIQEFPTISATGTIHYGCSPWWYNVSLTIPILTISTLGDTVNITNVAINYSNLTDVLSITGTVAFSNVQGTIQLTYDFGASNTITSLSLLVTVGVGLFQPTLPFGNSFGGAVIASQNGLISPTGTLAQVEFAWNYDPNTFLISAYLQDGSFEGDLTLNLQNLGNATQPKWSVTFAEVMVGLTPYGSITLSGNSPCDGLSATCNLNLPVVGQQSLTGSADFACNGSSISSYNVSLSDSMTMNLFGATEQVDATITYESAIKSLQVVADFNQNISLALTYMPGNYSFTFQVNQPTPFSLIPFSSSLGNTIDSANATTIPLSDYVLQYAQLNYTSNNTWDALNFTCSIEDSDQSDSGLLAVLTDFYGPGDSLHWTLSYVLATLTVLVDNVAQIAITLQGSPTCNNGWSPELDASITLSNLPLSIPNFALSGTTIFGCKNNAVDYDIFNVTAQFESSLTLKFLGDVVPITNLAFSYSTMTDIFSITWLPDPFLSFLVTFGGGVNGGFTFSANYTSPGTMSSSISTVGDSMSSVSALVPILTSNSASDPTSSISNELNGIKLNYVEITFDEPNQYFEIASEATFYNAKVDLFLFASKPTGSSSYSMVFGVNMTESNTSKFHSGMAWLDNIFNGADGFKFSYVAFCLVTGPGIFVLPAGQEIQSFGPGLVIQGDILLSCLSFATSWTGAFGSGVNGTSKDGVSVYFMMDITDTEFDLIIDLSSNVQSNGNTSNSYTEISFAIESDFETGSLAFEFLFTYGSTWGGQPLIMTGGLGVEFGVVGLSILLSLAFEGLWNNPFGLSSELTVTEIAAQMVVDEFLSPQQIDIDINAQIDDRYDQTTTYIEGVLMWDIVAADGDNAVSIGVSDFSLATIVNMFLTPPTIPSWAQNALKSMTLGSANFSWNPSPFATSFTIPTDITSDIIQPGLYIGVTNLNYLGLIVIEQSYFCQNDSGIFSSYVMAPVQFGNVFSLTAPGDPSNGPEGTFALTSTQMSYTSYGQMIMFGEMVVTVNMSMVVEPDTGKSSTSFSGVFTYYDDYVNLTMQEMTGGSATANWLFLIDFSLNTSYSSGFFGALFDGFNNQTQALLNTVTSSVVNYVNQQAAASIAIADSALASAEQNLAAVESSVDAAIANAQNNVNSCQNTVNSWQSTCSHYKSRCAWYRVYDCVAYGGCEATLGVSQSALYTAQQTLSALENSYDDVIAAAEASVASAQDAVNSAIEAGESLVDGTMTAMSNAMDALLSEMSSSVSWVVNLQELDISGELSASSQTEFTAEMTAAFFGGSMNSFSLYFDLNDLSGTVDAMLSAAAEDLGNWLVAELAGTPAAQFSSYIYNSLVTSAQAQGKLDDSGIGATSGSNVFFAGQTLQSANGQSTIYSPSQTFALTLFTNGSFILYQTSNNQVVWSVSTSQDCTCSQPTTCACQAAIDGNGNLLLQDVNNNVYYQISTAGGQMLMLEDTGSMFILDSSSNILWASTQSYDYLVQPGMAGQNITNGYGYTSWSSIGGGNYVYNVGVSNQVSPLWTSPSFQGQPPFSWYNPGTGSVSIIDSTGTSMWSTSTTSCTQNCFLQLTTGGGLILTDVSLTQNYLTIVQGVPQCTNTLQNGQTLQQNQKLCASNGDYVIMQSDNNLVYYSGTNAVVWASNTGPTSGTYYAGMQSDNNFVIYNQNQQAVWSTGTNQGPQGSGYLSLNNGRLQLLVQNVVVWNVPSQNTLQNGQTLVQGQSMIIENGNFLVMQGDNNLVYYTASGQVIWASGTESSSGQYWAIMQSDNNFVIYDQDGHAKWATGTNQGTAGTGVLQLTNTQVQIVVGGVVKWSS